MVVWLDDGIQRGNNWTGAVFLSSEDKETRQDMALGAASTFLGVIGQIITLMTPGTEADRFAVIADSTMEK